MGPAPTADLPPDPAHHHAHGLARSVSAGATRARRLTVAILLNLGIVVGQLVAGLIAGSVGLMADAAHNLTDVLALVVSLVAVRMARRPSTAARSFGWHRGTVLAALFNAAAILAVCGWVVIESAQRLVDPEPVQGGVVVVAALCGAVVNLVAALIVREPSRDLNMRGAVLHLLSDAATSVAVAVTGAIILVTGGGERLDPIAALVISVIIGWQGWQLARAATSILLEGTPAGVDAEEVSRAIVATDGVDAVHDLHAWSLSSDLHALSAHVVVSGHPSLEEAQVVAERVKHRLHQDFAIDHATLELECEPCADDPHCHADPVDGPTTAGQEPTVTADRQVRRMGS